MPFRIMICNQGIIFLKQLFKETLSLSIYIAADQRHVFSDNTLTHGAHHINLFSNKDESVQMGFFSSLLGFFDFAETTCHTTCQRQA